MRDKPITYWILLGLLLRFIVMPLAMHPDILHIYYHPCFLASEGILDIYSYHADFFKGHRYHYYAPLTYLFFGSYLYLARPFLAGFDAFMKDVREVTDHGGGHSAHYLVKNSTDRLFRFLFLMKLPYLLFDIGLLGLLVKFNNPQDCWDRLLKLWALNPLLIYTCYLLGQFDIIPTFFLVLGAFFAFKKKNTLAMVSLGVGTAFKSFPLFLIFPFAFYLGQDIKKIIKYVFIGVMPLFIIIAPFYLLSGTKVMGAFFSERISCRLGVANTLGVMRVSIFVLGYLFLCLSLLKKSVREKIGEMWPIKVSFLALALLFIVFPLSFHYFLWITPFILILDCNLKSNKIMGLYLLAVFSLGLVALAGKGVWFGLFSPIYPEFFVGLPSVDELIKRALSYRLVKKLGSFVFMGTLVWMSIVVFKDKTNLNA